MENEYKSIAVREAVLDLMLAWSEADDNDTVIVVGDKSYISVEALRAYADKLKEAKS